MAKFQKGVSGNPGGRKPLPPELKAVREITAHELKRIISKFSQMTKAEVEATLKDDNSPILHQAIAAIFVHSVRHGDYSRLSFLMDRVAGKPVSELEAESGVVDGANEISITPQNIAEICKAARDG